MPQCGWYSVLITFIGGASKRVVLGTALFLFFFICILPWRRVRLANIYYRWCVEACCVRNCAISFLFYLYFALETSALS